MRRQGVATLALSALVAATLAFAGPDAPQARIAVAVPPAARSAAVVMLELSVSIGQRSPIGHPGAVVRLGHPGGPSVEIGRLSLARSAAEQRYQFNVAAAVRRLNLAGTTAEVEVALIDRGGTSTPPDAALFVGGARIVLR